MIFYYLSPPSTEATVLGLGFVAIVLFCRMMNK